MSTYGLSWVWNITAPTRSYEKRRLKKKIRSIRFEFDKHKFSAYVSRNAGDTELDKNNNNNNKMDKRTNFFISSSSYSCAMRCVADIHLTRYHSYVKHTHKWPVRSGDFEANERKEIRINKKKKILIFNRSFFTNK